MCDGHKTNDAGRKRVNEIQSDFAKKSLTNDGKDRKTHILEKVISQNTRVCLISNIYTDELFKSMVLVFKQKELQVHKLHDHMVMTPLTLPRMFHEARSHIHYKSISIENNIRADIKTSFGR